MTRRRRTLNDEDKALWRQVTATVTPLEARPVPVSPAPESAPSNSPAKPKRPRPVAAMAESARKAPPAAPAPAPVPQERPLNRRWERALRRGTLAAEAVIDLHGLTEAEAHRSLVRFVAAATAMRYRTVLVITGKGREGRGVLKSRLPQWLAQSGLREDVLALHPAHAKDGGGGAWYIVLRRPRPARDRST